jgi:organic hydroperoxide reductase OsmC/OhrA
MKSTQNEQLFEARCCWTPSLSLDAPGIMHWPDVEECPRTATGCGVPTGLPVEMGGPRAAATPEHFLAASVASCLGLTVQILLQKHRLNSLLQSVEARIDMHLSTTGVPSISAVHASIHFDRPSEGDSPEITSRLHSLIQRAEGLCLVSRAIASTHPVQVTGYWILESQPFYPANGGESNP